MATTAATEQDPKPTGDTPVIGTPDNAVNSGISSIPDPIASPTDFLEYLRSLSIPDLVASWEHLQRRPVRLASTNRYVRTAVSEWSDRMDALIGRLSRVQRMHPNNGDACDAVLKACTEAADEIFKEMSAQEAEVAEEIRRQEEEEDERRREQEKKEEERRALRARLAELEEQTQQVINVDDGEQDGEGEGEDEGEDEINADESGSDNEMVSYHPPCAACKKKKVACTGVKGKACNTCRKTHGVCSKGVIHRPRQVKIKAEPTSPQADTNKRKFDAVTVTDVDDDAQMDDLTPPVVKVAKGAKGVKARPAKAASSKMQADVAPVNTRKSSRLHPSENPAKKARVSPLRQTEQPDVLFRRLAANFATIGQTLEEIADTVRLF